MTYLYYRFPPSNNLGTAEQFNISNHKAMTSTGNRNQQEPQKFVSHDAAKIQSNIANSCFSAASCLTKARHYETERR